MKRGIGHPATHELLGGSLGLPVNTVVCGVAAQPALGMSRQPTKLPLTVCLCHLTAQTLIPGGQPDSFTILICT